MDPGGYGTITISKAITIDGGSQFGSILSAATTYGVVVNGGSNDQITLRRLWVNGASQYVSPGTTGIKFNSGRNLTVENVVLENFTTYGIDFRPTTGCTLIVTDSTIENAGNDGIIMSTATSVNRAVIRQTWIHDSGINGLEAGANNRIEVYSSIASRNGLSGSGDGILANGANTNVAIDDSMMSNNGGSGIHTQGGGIIRVNRSSMNDNIGKGANVDTGQIYTGGNNHIADNQGGSDVFSGPIPLS